MITVMTSTCSMISPQPICGPADDASAPMNGGMLKPTSTMNTAEITVEIGRAHV